MVASLKVCVPQILQLDSHLFVSRSALLVHQPVHASPYCVGSFHHRREVSSPCFFLARSFLGRGPGFLLNSRFTNGQHSCSEIRATHCRACGRSSAPISQPVQLGHDSRTIAPHQTRRRLPTALVAKVSSYRSLRKAVAAEARSALGCCRSRSAQAAVAWRHGGLASSAAGDEPDARWTSQSQGRTCRSVGSKASR